MASNLVYETIQDNDGFLWVATDNGISRFDGKRFINYTTKNGLPSNDVIQVIKQNDGTIWANCYKQPPSYFDEKLNQFVCLEYDKHVLEISNGLFNAIYPIHKSEVFFLNNLGSFTVNNRKVINKIKYTDYDQSKNRTKLYFNDQLVSLKGYDSISNNKKYLVTVFFQNNKNLGTIIQENSSTIINNYYNNNSIYRFSSNTITQIKITNLKPFKYNLVTIIIPKTLKWYKFSDSKLSVTFTNGTVLIYDEKTLQLLSTIKNQYNVNTAYIDNQNNVWIATLNNGLMYYTNKSIKKEIYSDNVISNFLCAKVSDNGKLFAGNYQGEIYVKKEKIETKYNFSNLKENNVWIRNIHFFLNKTIVVSDKGLNINCNKQLNFYDYKNVVLNVKASTKLNYNTLILGSIQGLIKYDVTSEKYQILNFNKERVLNVKRKNDHSFYFSANEGLYEYDIETDKYQLLISNNLFKNDKIQYFEIISNSKIWLSTYKGNLFLFDNYKIKKQFINDERIPINISKLMHIDDNLWIASKTGIYILNYKDLINCRITKLTIADGLTSNAVNSLDFKNDTIYAATDNGVSKIPKNNITPNYSIIPKLISVKVNGGLVLLQSKYKLKSNQNNIILELSGVDITGHFKNFQYAINNSKYISINGSFLNLKLNNGNNAIIIRAIDENNKIQTNKIQLEFEINTPFYKSIWFWSLATFIISTLLYIYFNRRKLEKQKNIFEHQLQLEQQRYQITADLHDDIGSTLSSLQLNSAIANQLIKKDINRTELLLEKIENQSKDLADKIGDIIWSMKPGKDEFMTMSSRIKNFANDILSITNIDYKIKIDSKIDTIITDVNLRKNIVLITKEAINNCAKYSKAKKVLITLKKDDSNFELIIKDDGIGFDPQTIKGNGISNMRKRAIEINADLTIESQINNGTRIKLNFPCP